MVTDLYDAIPKVELHCHVEGTVRPATVVELARPGAPPRGRPGSGGDHRRSLRAGFDAEIAALLPGAA